MATTKSKKRASGSGRKKQRFDSYVRRGKRLRTKFNEVMESYPGDLMVSAWRDVQLPEYLWVALIVSNLEESVSIPLLREVAELWPKIKPGRAITSAPGSHSLIKDLHYRPRRVLLQRIVALLPDPSILCPVLLLPQLPAYDDWQLALPPEPQDEDWDLLCHSLIECGQHQSDRSTDIYWFINQVGVVTGALIEPNDPALTDRRLHYPSNRVEMGGFFRASGIQQRFRGSSGWPEAFWKSVWLRLPSRPADRDLEISSELDLALDSILPTYIQLLEHHLWNTRSGSHDAVHEMLFGLLFHSAIIAYEVVRLRVHTGFLGTIALRTVVECTINLCYLIHANDATLWKRFRDHGYGQAQKICEKLAEDEAIANVVDRDWLTLFATEEKADYFIDINLGDWEGRNIRQRSEDGGTKDLYDAYFDFTSSAIHGDWLGLNAFGLVWDINPLHRLQHIPRRVPRKVPSVIPDLFRLLNRQIAALEEAIPGLAFSFPNLR